MTAELDFMEILFDPLFFHSLGKIHDDEEEEYRCHDVTLFDTNFERYGGVKFTDNQYHLTILVHSCYC